MKTLLRAEEELDSKQHASVAEKARHFKELVHCGSVSTRTGINLLAESVDLSSGAAYMGLPMQSAAGLTSMKVGKRKSRVSRKSPIRVFSADAASFMAMVHKLTGLQSPAHLLPGFPQTSLLKPVVVQPFHPSVQGCFYTPDPPACDKMGAIVSNNSFSCASSQIKSSGCGRQQFDFINNGSLSTKEGLNMSYGASANRFPPSIYNPAFEALHWQDMRNINSLYSREEKSSMESFNDHRILCEDTMPLKH